MKRKKRKTGEKEVFRTIWESRPHYCEDCGAGIREAKPINFAHIKPKGRYPELRLEPDNIKLVCARCHLAEHTGGNASWHLPD